MTATNSCHTACQCPPADKSESLSVQAARLADGLEKGITRYLTVRNQTLGHFEMEAEQQSKELLRQATEKAARAKADQAPPVCPVCQSALSRVSHDHQRRFECRFGTITLRRSRGYCRKCRKWRFPADFALGLEETAGYSPRVQEMAALLASKMPVGEASSVLELLTGVRMPRSTLDREARPLERWSLLMERFGFGVWPMIVSRRRGSGWIITMQCSAWQRWAECFMETMPKA